MNAARSDDRYPSRVGGEDRILDRCDPVLHDKPRGMLTRFQRESLEANGYVAIDGLLTPDEVQECRQEIARLRTDTSLREREEVFCEVGSGVVRSVFAVHRLSPLFDRLSRRSDVLEMVEEILGSEVYIHQCRINYKPGFGGREFFWHSDFETWHVEDGMPRMRAISLSVNLTENVAQNGPLLIIPGSHHKYVSCAGTTPEDNYRISLRRQTIGVPGEDAVKELLRMSDNRLDSLTGHCGSAVLFDSNCMHGSNSNITPFPRSNFFVVYNSIENSLVEPYCGRPPRPEFVATRHNVRPLARAA